MCYKNKIMVNLIQYTIVVKNKILFSKLIYNDPSYFCTAFDLNIYSVIKPETALSNVVAP